MLLENEEEQISETRESFGQSGLVHKTPSGGSSTRPIKYTSRQMSANSYPFLFPQGEAQCSSPGIHKDSKDSNHTKKQIIVSNLKALRPEGMSTFNNSRDLVHEKENLESIFQQIQEENHFLQREHRRAENRMSRSNKT